MRTRRRHPKSATAVGADVLLAVGLAAIGFVELTVALGPDRTPAWAVPLALAAPLIWRRDRPFLVALVVTLVLVVQLPLAAIRVFDQTFTGYACLFVAVYSVGRHGGRWKLPVASLSASLAGLTIGLYDGGLASGGLAFALVIAPGFVGHAVQKRIRLRHLLEEQSAELEASSLVEAAAEAAATRTRIAGEVEDVVHRRVHDMAERATLARRQATSDPNGAARAVEGIEAQGREALAEMRGLVGVLRGAVPAEPSQVDVETADPAHQAAALDGVLRRADPWLSLLFIAFTAVESAMAASSGSMPVAAVVGAAMATPLLARRRFPVAASATGWGVAAAMALWFDLPLTSLALLAPLYAYAAGASTSRHRRAGLAIGLVGVIAVNAPSASAAWGDYVFPAMLVTLGWLAGSTVAEQGRMTAAAAGRAHDLERLRTISTRTAAIEERLRIARELHDVAAHTLMIMVVQAGAARRSLERGRDGWAEALDVVSSTGASASVEMQHLLSLVRPGVSGAPTAGLGRVPALVEQVRSAGLAVDLEMEGPTDALPGGLQLAAYRIVQEALTNVVRHAGASRVSVLVRRGAQGLTLEIGDDGRQPAAGNGGGNGIAGMRERAQVHGGDLDVGPRPGGGFRVAVTFPVGAMSEARTA